jgi:hypothetical protein
MSQVQWLHHDGCSEAAISPLHLLQTRWRSGGNHVLDIIQTSQLRMRGVRCEMIEAKPSNKVRGEFA